MEEEKLMTIKIKDNGDGMPPSKLEKTSSHSASLQN